MHLTRTLIILLFIASISLSFCFFKRPRDYTTMAKEIRAKVEKTLVQKHQMDCIGDGGGMMGSVYMIGLHFSIHRPMDKDGARELIIDCVEELLAAVNANEEIRPFLKDYPFTPKNVHMSIFFDNPDGSQVFDPYISVVTVYINDKIYFSTKEPNKVPYKHRYTESYPEALAKVRAGQKPSVLHQQKINIDANIK